MKKRRLFSTLLIFLFLITFVSFLVPSGLNAETQNFWVDTSHMVYQGHWEDYTKRTWVDTSHWETRYRYVRQAYKVWLDSGYWKTIYYQVWVKSGYWKTVYGSYQVWVDTSHYFINK